MSDQGLPFLVQLYRKIMCVCVGGGHTWYLERVEREAILMEISYKVLNLMATFIHT